VSYFLNWGSIKNPIRQSDLGRMFESKYGCAKRFYLEKEVKKLLSKEKSSYEAILGILFHKIVSINLLSDSYHSIKSMIKKWEDKKYIIDFRDKDKEEITEEYQEIIDLLFDSKEYKNIKKNVIEVEKSFLFNIVKDIYIAGTIDVIIKNKNGIACIDWKTGKTPISQFEMDNGYQSLAYCIACKMGEFFNTPDDNFSSIENGEEYYQYYIKSFDKVKFNKWPKFFYCYPRDLIPAKRSSTRSQKHKSNKKSKDGKITIEKGDRKGTFLYESAVKMKSIPRFIYTIKTAKALSDSGLFPESMGSKCEYCTQKEICLNYGKENIEEKEKIIEIMKELGIE
jgi:hypothetical protein